jgi:hypothetical protein
MREVLSLATMAHELIALGYLLPALLPLALLAFRRYPGERALIAVVTRRRRLRRARVFAAPPTRRLRASAATPRGPLLMGCSLAVRPPPRALPLH